jgi:hypothetical protein
LSRIIRPQPPRTPRSGFETGFTVFELVIVVSIGMIIVSTSLYAFLPARRAYGTDEAAAQLQRFLRDGVSRAITHRQPARLFLNTSTSPRTVPSASPTISCPPKTIMMIDENNAGTGDEEVVRAEPLASALFVKIGRPNNLASIDHPPAPHDFATATIATSGTWEAYCLPAGSIANGSGTPMSATFYLYSTSAALQSSASDLTLVRAVTLFGPTGTVRLWRRAPSGSWVGR